MKDKTRHNLGVAFMVLGVISMLAGISALPHFYNYILETYEGYYRIYTITRAFPIILLPIGYLLFREGYLWFKQKGWILVKCTKCEKILRKPNYWPKKTFKPNERVPAGGHFCKKFPAGRVTFVAYETEQTLSKTP